MKQKKTALFQSVIALILCISMLMGTTFAWFTDSVTTGINTIAAGVLDVELYHSNAAVADERVDTNTKLFMDLNGNPILWEPGVVSYENLRITNAGDLALAYQLALNTDNENFVVEESGAQYGLSQILKVGFVEGGITATDRAGVVASVEEGNWTTLASFVRSGALLPEGEGESEKTWGVVIYWEPGENDNYWNLNNGKQLNEGEVLMIDLGVKLIATQEGYESDSFGADYDSEAKLAVFPVFVAPGSTTTTVVPNDQNQVASGLEMSAGQVSASIPAGVQLAAGTTELTMSVSEMDQSDANISLGVNEAMRSLDVHIEGVDNENNTVPMTITLKEIAPVGLNMGNYKLYHVENGQTNEMTLVEEFTAHNQFKYDPATGDVTLYMATFSEVTCVVDTHNPWNGDVATGFSGGEGTEKAPYIIANADELAYFSKVVGYDSNSFKDQYVKLIADINLGDKNNASENLIFHPIGYYYTDDKNTDGTTGDYYSTVNSFEGTFDGNGHTIANFYQNTWEIKGDYEGNYYSDAMGLFGYVKNGTVKNLTVDHFSSDGEYTPTGVIAAYAVNSTFENIAITNCNPRVYNTGNGGIVGIGGNSDDPDTYKLTFNNITIDNTNIISALWGSWDVACGGLVGMFRGAGHVYMTNCHVAAQIDVFNDVCGNYQYYWYRYAGMMVGTNKNMITDKDGYTVPETSKFHAENCTVHFGDWNDYYYCELVANSLASYTHDHQFSRLDQIQNVSEIQDENGNWNKTGNFILMNGKVPTNTCYHIMKDANGNLYEHMHNKADATNPEIYDVGIDVDGDGKDDLKENNQRVFLPFNQLFTGYGWGVKHIPVYNGEDYAFEGITILDRVAGSSHQKFEGKVTELANDTAIKLGDIFNAKFIEDDKLTIKSDKVQVTVSPVVDANGNPSEVTGVYVANTEDWTQGTLTLSGTGAVTITITDYYFCTPTTIEVDVTERQYAEKFETKFTGNFLYRVGSNKGSDDKGDIVKLDSLFKAKDGAQIGNVSVTIEALNGTAASGTYTSDTTWQNGSIKFSGTGVVKVTITDNDYCTPTELSLEVVDAINVTSATSATKNNVVLLNDCGFSSLEVSGGYTLYGNGFTMTCASDSAALDMGYSFVTLNNGTLDNVQIVCPNFDYAVLYKSNMTESGNRSETTDRTRYYNVKSGVMVTGNSQILNSRISGARAAVNVAGGNLVIDNSRIELGAVASILVGAANSLTLRDVTLVQKPAVSTHDSTKTLMGFSVLIVCDGEGNSAPITLEGTLIQNAWVDESDKKYVPSAGRNIVANVLKEDGFLHDIDGDGTRESLNLGFAYMPETAGGPVNTTSIVENDNRINKSQIPYEIVEVSLGLASVTTYVYSYKYQDATGTNEDIKQEGTYVPDTYGDIITVTYSDTTEGLTNGKSYGADGWVYELNVDLDKLIGFALDFGKLSMSVNGVSVTDFKVDGNAKPTTPVSVAAGGTIYTLTASVDGQEYTATLKVTGTETSKDSPKWSSDAQGTSLSTTMNANWEAGLCVASSKGGTWHGAAPALQNVYVKYWSVEEGDYKTIHLADVVSFDKGKLNETNNTWTFTPDNGDFTLTLTGGQVHSGNQVNAMPVGVDTDNNQSADKLYFVAAKSTGLVNSGNSARTIPVTYSFKDNNGGTELKGSHTWSVAENTDAEYKYSDFCNGTMTKLEDSSCVTSDTLINLADGTQKRIDHVDYQDELLVWDFYNGTYATVPASIIWNHGDAEYDVTSLYFDDGTVVEMINSHGFFDVDNNNFVYLTEENAKDYIGHSFVKVDGNSYTTVKLVDYSVERKFTGCYSIQSAVYNNFMVENMFSMTTPDYEGWFDYFNINDDMKYDEEHMNQEIAKYGLCTYDEVSYLGTYEQYVALNAQYLKILIGRGVVTMDQVIEMLEKVS